MLALLLVVTACSGDDDAPEPVASSTPENTVVSGTAADDSSDDPDDRDGADDASVGTNVPAEVSVVVEIDGEPSGELGGLVADSDDPFGQFVSCSGVRSTFGTYVVIVSALEGAVRAVSVATDDIVEAPGVHDATIRVESSPEAVAIARGTVTIDDDYRSGSFTAFDAEGRRVAGEFDCAGGDDPAPLDPAAEQVEVFALLRSNDSQRLVGLTAPVGDGVICAAEDGAPVVRVEGDRSTGAITAFELTAEPALTMVVGATEYSFADVTIGGTSSAGTFSGDTGGVTVDGAFSCP